MRCGAPGATTCFGAIPRARCRRMTGCVPRGSRTGRTTAELRFALPLEPPSEPARLAVPTDGQGTTSMRLLGRLALPAPLGASLDVWWLEQYGGGLFLPLRDGTAADTSYGGGRYALDTAKGADLGTTSGLLVVDLNFLYHPSCRYNPAWQCPLAPAGNVIAASVRAGERL